MAERKYSSSHNQVAFLEKVPGAEAFADVIDFLNATHLRYALTENPTIYKSHMEQFWSTVRTQTNKNGEQQLMAMVDGKRIIISESYVRKALNFLDEEEIICLENDVIFKELENMGYEKKKDVLTFYKPLLCPHWKFLIHTILHCLSPKTTAWNEFSSRQASAIIFLATGKPFNFSAMVMDGFKKNVSGEHYIYPRFLQLIVNKQLSKPKIHKRTYRTPMLKRKLFSYLKKSGKGFSGTITPLFPHMLQLATTQGQCAEITTPTHPTPTSEHSSSHPHNTQTPRISLNKNTYFHQTSVKIDADEAATGVGGGMMEGDNTTDPGLVGGQVSVNISKTLNMATPTVQGSHEPESNDENPSQMAKMGSSGDQPRFHTDFEPNDSTVREGNTSRRDEGKNATDELRDTQNVQDDNSSDQPDGADKTSLMEEYMTRCRTLESQVFDLTQTVKQMKMRINLSKGRQRSRTRVFKRLKKAGTAHRVSSPEGCPSNEGNDQVDMDVDSGIGANLKTSNAEQLVKDSTDEVIKPTASTRDPSPKFEPSTAEDDDVSLAQVVVPLNTSKSSTPKQSTPPTESQSQTQPTSAPEQQPQPQLQPTTNQTNPSPTLPRAPDKGVTIREPTAEQKSSSPQQQHPSPQPKQYEPQHQPKSISQTQPITSKQTTASTTKQPTTKPAIPRVPVKCVSVTIREPTPYTKPTQPPTYTVEAKGKMMEELENAHDSAYVPYHRWPKEIQAIHPERAKFEERFNSRDDVQGKSTIGVKGSGKGKEMMVEESEKAHGHLSAEEIKDKPDADEANKPNAEEVEEDNKSKEKESKAKSTIGVKRTGRRMKTMARRKKRTRRVVVSSSEGIDETGYKKKETVDLQLVTQVVSDDDDLFEDTAPSAVKSPVIGWKAGYDGKVPWFEIRRVAGRMQRFKTIPQMLKHIDRKDLVNLSALMKNKYGNGKPTDELDRVLCGYLTTMFQASVQDSMFVQKGTST